MTVLHKACEQLASTATGKAAETRLQKSLDKLQKLQQASASADATPSTGPDSGTQPKAAAKLADNQQQQTVATVVGTVSQGQRNAELSQQNQSSDVVGTVPSAEPADMDSDMKENLVVAQQQSAVPQKAEGSQPQKPDSSSQTDKGQVLAEKKVQKEEAKVSAAPIAHNVYLFNLCYCGVAQAQICLHVMIRDLLKAWQRPCVTTV